MLQLTEARAQPSGTDILAPALTFKRIRITKRDDLEALYNIVVAYVAQPELGFSVESPVLDADSWPKFVCSGCNFHKPDKELNEPAVPVGDDAAHAALERHVEAVGLSAGSTDEMLRAKRRHLMGLKPEVRTRVNERAGFFLHNAEFALALHFWSAG